MCAIELAILFAMTSSKSHTLAKIQHHSLSKIKGVPCHHFSYDNTLRSLHCERPNCYRCHGMNCTTNSWLHYCLCSYNHPTHPTMHHQFMRVTLCDLPLWKFSCCTLLPPSMFTYFGVQLWPVSSYLNKLSKYMFLWHKYHVLLVDYWLKL
jgi:hypothetical protein